MQTDRHVTGGEADVGMVWSGLVGVIDVIERKELL